MRYTEQNRTWVVYEERSPGKPKRTLVCEQADWDTLLQSHSTRVVLIQGAIANEGEAERLARSGAVPVPAKAPISRPPSLSEQSMSRSRRLKAVTENIAASCVSG